MSNKQQPCTGQVNGSVDNVSRRQALAGAAAVAGGIFMPPGRSLAATSLPVVIVGAGMAGLAAATVFKQNRIPFILVEARNRIGGRAFTDSSSFGVPFDYGCSWLHAAKSNPLTPIAAGLGFTLATDPDNSVVYVGSTFQSNGANQLDNADNTLEAALDRAGAAGKDVAASTIINPTSIWEKMAVWSQIGPNETGVETSQMSTLDWYNQVNTGNGLDSVVKEGLGSVVAAYGAGIPVSLSTIVTGIQWSSSGVSVMTSKGTITGAACLLTVPVGVLRAGTISFTPALPTAKKNAISGIAMGLLNKIGLKFKPGFLPNVNATWLEQWRNDGTVGDVLMRPWGRDVTVHFFGGSFGRQVESMTDAAQFSLALATIKDCLGNSVAAACTGGVVTRWGQDPYSFGAYSAALPGQASQRTALAAPVGRLYFAGEACSSSWATMLPGAYYTGQSAAQAIMRAI